MQPEIVVDTHDAQEQALGWYYYLEEQLRSPFPAQCTAQRTISPLEPNQQVEGVDLAPPEEGERDRFVMVTWPQRTIAVPWAQLKAMPADKATRQAPDDWHYGMDQGYEF